MKKYFKLSMIMLIPVLIAFLLSGCLGFGGTSTATATPTEDPNATPAPDRDPNLEFKVYEGDGFKISYQPNWYVAEKSDVSEVTISSYDVNTAAEGNVVENGPGVSVVKIPLSNEEKESFDLKKYTEESISDLKAQIYNFTIIKNANDPDFENIELDNETAYAVEYTGTIYNINDIVVKQIFTYKDGNKYIITYKAVSSDYNNKNYADIADKTLKSFTFS